MPGIADFFDPRHAGIAVADDLAGRKGEEFGNKILPYIIDRLPASVRDAITPAALATGVRIMGGPLKVSRRIFGDKPWSGTAHEYANNVLDAFVRGIAKAIEEKGRPPTGDEANQLFEDAHAKAGSKEMVLAFDQVHVSEDCPSVQSYKDGAVIPGKTDKKTGKKGPDGTKAVIKKIALSRALAQGKALCPVCNPGSVPEAAHPRRDPERNLARTLGELKAKEPVLYASFYPHFMRVIRADPGLGDRFRKVFGPLGGIGTLDDLKRIAEKPQNEWDFELSNLEQAMASDAKPEKPAAKGLAGLVGAIRDREAAETGGALVAAGASVRAARANVQSRARQAQDRADELRDNRKTAKEKEAAAARRNLWILAAAIVATFACLGRFQYHLLPKGWFWILIGLASALVFTGVGGWRLIVRTWNWVNE